MKRLVLALALFPSLASAQSVDDIIKRTIGEQFITLTSCQIGLTDKDKEIARLKAEIESLKPKEEGK